MKRFWMTSRLFLLALATVTLTLSACKNDDPEDDNTNTSSASTTPSFGDGDAVLAAVKSNSTTSTPIGPINTVISTATAAFGPASGFADVGAVTADGGSLTKQSNNAYVYTPSATNPTGITFTSDPVWTVAGGNGFSSFDGASGTAFPASYDFASGTSATVTKSQGVTLTIERSSGSTAPDSVLFNVIGQNGSVATKTIAGSSSSSLSVTFSASELANVGTGTGMIQAAAYRYNKQTVGGKNWYFVNETVATKSVTVE